MSENIAEIRGGRIPPQSIEAEEAALSACLGSEKALSVVVALLNRDDFYKPAHRIVFEAIESLYIERSPVDLITTAEQLLKSGDLQKVGGSVFLSYLADIPILHANAAEYAGIVRQKSQLRKLIDSLDQILKTAFEGDREANDLVDLAQRRLSDLREGPNEGGFEKVYDIIARTAQEIHDIVRGKKSQVSIRSGFPKLDKALGGFKPGTLTIIAARPGMGKSAFAINIATNAAIYHQTTVCFYSLEMSKKEIGNRILASRSEVTTDDLQNARVSLPDFDKIGEALGTLAGAPFYIEDKPGLNVMDMLSQCKQIKSAGKLDLVVIDYLQLMSAADRRADRNRQNEISEISRSLKMMAKELEVPVVALSQLSRGAEYRDDRRPMLSDLRDSGAIEQDADAVLFIYRDKYYKTNEERQKIEDAEIIIAKNRQGPSATVEMKWWAERTLFFEDEESGKVPEVPEYIKRQKSPDAKKPEEFLPGFKRTDADKSSPEDPFTIADDASSYPASYPDSYADFPPDDVYASNYADNSYPPGDDPEVDFSAMDVFEPEGI